MAGERKSWLPHFCTFCELAEGEENKLTTFSTWTIMLGCNIIFQQQLCKLGQLRRSNGRNSQVLGQAMKKRPTGHYKKYSHFKGRDTAPTTSSREGSCIVDSSTLGERTLLCSSNPGPAGSATHVQFYHVTIRRMTKYFVRRYQSIYVYNLCSNSHLIGPSLSSW